MSFLPDKYTPINYSLLGVAAFIVEVLRTNDTVSTLWDRVRDDQRVRTFDRYSDALSLLFASGLLTFKGGTFVRNSPGPAE